MKKSAVVAAAIVALFIAGSGVAAAGTRVGKSGPHGTRVGSAQPAGTRVG